ncbi:type II toxin-antitoxin system toxin DNA ADP-ribosyl transferase DarT [Mycolicibacterium neworleansense]|uniref:DarT domain-containing protein n=1 Tax=Mycolicibacterium neworleansense TaxID=146018 RepID=A0A0H5RT29_9MYCO|nr:DUF4433 domain-containing protein [Mycolicibacterium neworleansense]MCV7361592.1 DUF4433 domain-containing protein [Mycolicibacterium neworleansense]CRZ16946.1 hypothetical protein BN2156_03825 [Mycolicibacterium neworleansense]
MPRPVPTTVAHFTHLDNLARIATEGLRCDSDADDGVCVTEVGEPSIKARRRHRAIKVAPGGVVADYVPFYFASRSPMLFSIHAGGVPSFTGDSHDVVYLMTTVEKLQAAGLSLVFTDRNAVLELARHSVQVSDLDTLVDWTLMKATYWSNTDDDPDRKERRMAECLAHRAVPWSALSGIAVFDAARAARARHILDSVAIDSPPINVRPEFYF